MQPSLKTFKRLCTLSNNCCAFPDCTAPIIETSGTSTGIVCHIKARRKGGPRYDPTQSDDDRHSFSNLILLCPRHSRIIDSEPNKYTVKILEDMKAAHNSGGLAEISAFHLRMAELLLKSYRTINVKTDGHVMIDSPGSVQATQVVFKNHKRSIKLQPPRDSLASDLSRRNYVKHLLDRYQEFARQQPGREFRYPAIYSKITKEFGAKWDLVPLSSFDNLVSFLQRRIDRTMLGSMNKGKSIPNYSTFSEYRAKYERMP